MPRVTLVILYCLFLGIPKIAYAQESDAGDDEWEPYIPLKDPSYEGQRTFVENLLNISGDSSWKKLRCIKPFPTKQGSFG